MPPWTSVLGRPVSFGRDTSSWWPAEPVSLSRTLQTQPRGILAARRAAAPRRSRGDEPMALARQRSLIGELGIDLPEKSDERPPARIRVSRCRPGYVHPIGRRDITEAIEFFGPLVTYGLR